MSQDGEGARLNWSVRHGAHSAYAQRVFEDTQEACLRVLRLRLPAEAGYELRAVRLRGLLRGTSFRISRGPWTATVSLQRFEHDQAQPGGPRRGRELRVVASAAHKEPDGPSSARRSGLGLSSGAAASLGVGTLALAVTGGMTAWTTAVLLIPAVFATRLCMTLWIADSMRQRALPPAEVTPPARNDAKANDRARWTEVLCELRGLHEATAERFVLRPFRGLGTGTSCSRPRTAAAATPSTDALSAELSVPLRSTG